MDGGAWWAAVHEVAKSRTRLKRLSSSSSSSGGSQPGDIFVPRGTFTVFRDIFICRNPAAERGTSGTWWTEVRDAAKHLECTEHSHNINSSDLKCQSARLKNTAAKYIKDPDRCLPNVPL